MNLLKLLFSPFRLPRVTVYFGEIERGAPYFHPRLNTKRGFRYLKYFGAVWGGLGWKTKWGSYRHEYNPYLSIVILGKQLHFELVPYKDWAYWEAWLTYEIDTDPALSTKERVAQLKELYPATLTYYTEEVKCSINLYPQILKDKYND